MNKAMINKILTLLFILSFIGVVPSVEAASIDDLLNKKEQLNQDLEKAQSAAQNKQNEAKSLQNQIDSLSSDITNTEKKIEETGGQISQKQSSIQTLSGSIDKKKLELADLKKKLNASIIEIYRSSSRSNLELLFSGENLGEAENQSNYIQSVQLQVKVLHTKVNNIKQDLEKQKSDEEQKKAELDQLKSQQVAYRKSTEYQRSEKDKLLGMTKEQQEQYETLATQIKSEVASVSSEIYAERRKRLSGGRESLGGGGSGYSFSCNNVDPWGFYTCQCTSYAAWYWNVMLGKSWQRGEGPSGTGDATNWPNLARKQGYSVSSTPHVGAIISWSAGGLTSGYGHVAIVEKVNSDGTIDLSEYNWIPLSYSYRKNVSPGDYGSYSYIY